MGAMILSHSALGFLLGTMGGADYIAIVGRVAKSTAQDASQRRLFARGDGVSAATLALHCLFSSLSSRWSCSKPQALDSVSDPGGGSSVPALPDGSSDWDETDLVECATFVCRIARNLFPEIDHQDGAVTAVSSQCLRLLLWYVASHTAHASSSSSADTSKLQLLLAAALQAVGNAVSSSRSLCAQAWEAAWPSPLLDVARGEGVRCQSIVGMIVYNSYFHFLRQSPSHQTAFAHEEPVGDLLAALLTTSYGTRAEVLSDAEKRLVADVAEWTQLLVAELLRDGFLIALHQRLSTHHPTPADSEGGGVEAEVDAEKLLWYLIEDLLSDDAEATGALHEPLVLSHGDCAYMASELGLMMTLCIQESQSAAAAGQDTSSPGNGGGGRVVERMLQLLQVLGACTTRPNLKIRQALRENGLITNCVRFLQTLFAAVPGTEAAAGSGHGEREGLVGVHGLKRDLVRVLANMCYNDRQSQDAVREAGGIPLILASTNIDERNPFGKEWAVLAIRNLCDNNLENQAEIAKLQPQQVQSVPPELQQKGIGLQLDEVGKLKAVRNEDCREEELRLMGLGDEVREARATGRSRLSVGGCGDGISSSGRAGPECKMETGADSEGEVPTEAECMAEELRGMGLHAEVDPDTGLMDIAHPRAKPTTFHYPLRDGAEGSS